MKTASSLVSVVLAMVLTGCLGGSVDASHQAAARRIGVISVLGDEGQGFMAGLPLRFMNSTNHGGAADLGVDAAACAHAIERLHAAYPGSAVINLQTERGIVRIPTVKHLNLLTNQDAEARNKAAADAARQLAVRHALNLVVMIVASQGNNGGSAQIPNDAGYGIWTQSFLGVHLGDVSVFANFAVYAFDGSTGQQLAVKVASVNGKVDDVPQRKSLDAYSPAERAKLAEKLHEIVARGADEQLEHMHLTP